MKSDGVTKERRRGERDVKRRIEEKGKHDGERRRKQTQSGGGEISEGETQRQLTNVCVMSLSHVNSA